MLDTSLADIQEGELVFARDEDALYVKDNGVLVNVGIGNGIGDFLVNAEITWQVGLVPGLGYSFSGQGFSESVPNPTLYVVRGQRYKFDHQLGSDPFRIVTPNDATYSTGIVGNPANNSVLRWEVSMSAPPLLKYKSDDTPGFEGNIVVLSDTFQTEIGELDDVSSAEPLNGQVLIYSTSTELWEPANLASGGAVTLSALTDVSIPSPATNEVLRYDGNVWVASPEAGGPENTGRKTSINVAYARTGQMNGTEFPLETEAEFQEQGFTVNNGAETPRGPEDFGSSFSNILEFNCTPLGRSDSKPADDNVYLDGTGRVWWPKTEFGSGTPVAGATKYLSVPENVAFAFVPFLEPTGTTLHIWGYKRNVTREGKIWSVLRAEYTQPGDKWIAIEHWWTDEGDLKTMYGIPVNGFTFDVLPNRAGFVFGGRTEDETLGEANTKPPLLDSNGDYVIELWTRPVGYKMTDLVDVVGDDVQPAYRGQQLTWVGDQWAPGSNVGAGTKASTSAGQLGLFSVDATYLYVAVGENQWKRIPLEAFS